MASKRTIEQDPEYEAIPNEIQEKRIKLIKDNVRNQTIKKIETIIKSNFEKAIAKKHEEIEAIDDLLHEGRCMLDRLRACIMTKYYANLDQTQSENTISPIHPCVKKYIGKSPRHLSYSSNDSSMQSTSSQPTEAELSNQDVSSTNPPNQILEKVWEVIPSNASDEISTRAPRFKKKCKIVVGNISKFIPVWQRNSSDQFTHKWMVYVRGDKHSPNIETFVKKVRFLLHPSYKPADIVDISSPPFHLIQRGWGEFPVRVQLHFHDPRNKPVDIIHNLKLDKTFTGLETLGTETVVELQLFKPDVAISSCNGPVFSYDSPIASNNENVTVTHNGLTVSDSSRIEQTCEPNVPTITKKGPNSLVVNIKLPKNNSSSNSSSDIVNTHSVNSISSCENSNPPRKLVPKLVISNNKVVTKPAFANGVNTTFVKCKDKEGRVLLVPQSSVTFKAPPNSIKLNNKTVVNNSIAKGNKSVPSYVLKLVPNKDTGQNQVLLFPLNDKTAKEKLSSPVKIKSDPVCPSEQESLFTDIDAVIKQEPGTEEVVTTSPNYEQELENIKMEYCKKFEDLLKRVCKVFPLIRKGVDRKVFTFCASSLEEFNSWNIGKRRACEWRRAAMVRKSILELLSKKNNPFISAESVWSQSAIMTWLRKNGFVPMATEKVTLLPEPKWSGIELCSLTTTDDLFSSLREEPSHLVSNSDDEEIEIIKICDSQKKSEKSPNKTLKDASYLPHFSGEALFVKQTASQIGIEIKSVEVEPHLYVPAIEEMVLSACQQFITDLVGFSLNEGFSRLGGKVCPEEVTVSDVYSAIKKIPQFDFLSNSFLGVPKEPVGTT